MSAPRWFLAVSLLVFVLGALVLPVWRSQRRSGHTGIVIQGESDPVERVVIFGSSVIAACTVGWAALYAALGPAALGVWLAPASVVRLGQALLSVGFVGVVAAQVQMGKSWRVGIDAVPTALVTKGLYGLARNPIYSALLAFSTGFVLVTPSAWTVMGGVSVVFVTALQARLEERHLMRMHGEAYAAYASRVGRFWPAVGRLRSGGGPKSKGD